jgi:hypothetical protein
MIRYTIFVLAIVASAATAIASLPGQTTPGINGKNVTNLIKNQTWDSDTVPVFLEKCAKEDCSDTPTI